MGTQNLGNVIGPKGDKGDTGAQGLAGPAGEQGQDGASAPLATATQDGLMPKEVFAAWENGEFGAKVDGTVIFSGNSGTPITIAETGFYAVTKNVRHEDNNNGTTTWVYETANSIYQAGSSISASIYSIKITNITRIL